VTPITTTSTVQISSSSSSNNSNNQLNMIDNNQIISNPTQFLSTFIPVSSINTLNNRNTNELRPMIKYNNNNNKEHEKEQLDDNFTKKNLTNNSINDIGYYGSSDYSDNNASISIPTVCQKPIKQYSNKSKIIQYQHQQSRSRFIQSNKTTPKTNSATSFTSSSLLSSPTSSSTSTSSESPLFATGLSNNNQVAFNSKNNEIQQDSGEIYIKPTNHLNVTKTKNSSSSSSTKNNDVKLYYERFERIYNSNELDQNTNSNQHPKQQCNSLTAYSYV
jgi:hypothetical protein